MPARNLELHGIEFASCVRRKDVATNTEGRAPGDHEIARAAGLRVGVDLGEVFEQWNVDEEFVVAEQPVELEVRIEIWGLKDGGAGLDHMFNHPLTQ